MVYLFIAEYYIGMKVSWILTGIVLLLIAYIYTMKNRVKRVGDKEVVYIEREQPITDVIVPEYVDDTVYYYPNWDWLPWYGWGGSGGDVNVYNRYGWGGGGRRWGGGRGYGGGYGGMRGGGYGRGGGRGGGMGGGGRGGMGGRGGGGRGGR
jgi:hypothetical protein